MSIKQDMHVRHVRVGDKKNSHDVARRAEWATHTQKKKKFCKKSFDSTPPVINNNRSLRQGMVDLGGIGIYFHPKSESIYRDLFKISMVYLQSINPHKSGNGFMGGNKSPLIRHAPAKPKRLHGTDRCCRWSP